MPNQKISQFKAGNLFKIPKGTVLLREGEFCDTGYRVEKGCLKSYFIDHSGKEHILQFAPEGWLISDINSLYNKVSSIIFIEAIEDSEIQCINSIDAEMWLKSDKDKLIEQLHLLIRNIIASGKRTRMLLSSTGEERYHDFVTTYPTLAQRIPLKLIASYIGVTPEYLSEIRRKLIRNK